MAGATTFHLSVITPERAVLEADASFVAFPAHDGEIGILPGRAPLLCKLGAGLLRADTAAGKHSLFVAGGFAQMVEDRLTLLTEQAKELTRIDRAEAERALAAARAMKVSDDASFRARQAALASARAQLKLSAR
ncbi:MAG TPA: ATP synthase F1 subunit epsilon [Thermoanaerobaculia bacterium]|nr:ATP synthase F1 subunit epsilon [Thermoanaerobaculia bacterium]